MSQERNVYRPAREGKWKLRFELLATIHLRVAALDSSKQGMTRSDFHRHASCVRQSIKGITQRFNLN
jgi:hypothetical protein